MTSSHSQTLVNLYGKGIDEPSEWGHRKIDGQAREGNGRDEWERTSQILERNDPTLTPSPSPAPDLRTFYYQQDHEGSVTLLTLPDGTVFERYRYDVFGTPTIYDGDWNVRTASAVSNRFLFTGREYAAAFGFYEYRNRAYHPGLGRFMSEDPIGFQIAGQKPSKEVLSMFPTQLPKTFEDSEFNLFRYCHNDPVDKSDPFGLLEFVFDSSFSKDAQGRFLDAVKLGASTSERGKYLANLPGTVKVLPTDVKTPTGAYKKGDDMRLYLNAKDPAFLDSQSRRDFQQFPTELPPSDAKGRSVTVFHEFGHFTGAKDESKRGHNVRDNENPVRRGLKLDDRESYKGVPVKQPY